MIKKEVIVNCEGKRGREKGRTSRTGPTGLTSPTGLTGLTSPTGLIGPTSPTDPTSFLPFRPRRSRPR